MVIAAPYGISVFIDGLATGMPAAMLAGGLIYSTLKIFDIGLGYFRMQFREWFFQEEFWFLPQAISRLSFGRPLSFLSGQSSDIDGGGIESLRDKVWNVIGSYIYTIIPILGQVTFGLGACFYAHPLIGVLALGLVTIELSLARMNNRFIQANMKWVIDTFKRADRRRSEWWHNLDHIKYHGVETKLLGYIHDEVQVGLKGDDAVWRQYYARWIAIRRVVCLVFAGLVFSTTGYLVLDGAVTGASGVLVFFAFERVQSVLFDLSDQQREVQFNLASIAKYRRTLMRQVPHTYNQGREFTETDISIRFDGIHHSIEDEEWMIASEQPTEVVDSSWRQWLVSLLMSTSIVVPSSIELPKRRKPILRDVCLDIPAGMRVGIVGPSGAGKSQLISLLVRASDPDSGRVLISGHDLRTLRTESLLRYYGVIMQKSEPFEDTILGNMLFGVSHLDLPVAFQELRDDKQKKILLERAHQALKKAGLDVSKMPQGILTSIGYKGTKLSGGQQQRLQIAGAHLKLAMSETRPRLIIADEPTASLDSLSEVTVMEHLQDNLPTGTTLLMIAHRLSTVQHMDRIVFVRPLSACEEGVTQVTMHNSLAELYAAEPLFREMADAQGFRPVKKKVCTV